MATSVITKVDTTPATQIINYTATLTTSSTAAYRSFEYELPNVSGYTPVGVVGFQTAAEGSTPSYTRISSLYLDGNTVNAMVRRNDNNANKTLFFQVLYFKSPS